MRKKTIVKLISAISIILLIILGYKHYDYAPYPITDASIPITSNLVNPYEQNIYVVNHGWHTGIVVDYNDLVNYLPQLKNNKPITLKTIPRFIEIGWGDQGFYTAHQIGAEHIFEALFNSKGSVIHIAYLNSNPKSYFDTNRVYKIKISANGYQKMLKFIEQSFAKKNLQIVNLGKGIYGDSNFFLATGKYSFFNTCNTWTSKALESGDIFENSYFKVASSQVIENIPNEKQ